MEKNHNTRLNSAEISGLWSQYINDTAAVCVLSYFLNHVEDRKIIPILEFALSSAKNHVAFLKKLFKQESFPIPIGFNEKDVNLQAPRLFSDLFYLKYLKFMSMLGMTASTMAIGLVSRSDVMEFHKKVLADAINLEKAVRKDLLEKGTYIRPPYITTVDQVEFASEQSYLGTFIGEQRPLTTVEISHLFLNIETNVVGKEMMMAFSQIAKRKKVKRYILRGKEIANKHVTVFSNIMLDNDLPASMMWDSAVTDSTERTFSDKLLMFHVTAMAASGIGNYGTAIGASPRRDIGLKYSRLLAEISFYAEDGENILIDYGWFERPPQAPNRDNLTKK